jgi:hypothetical protein
MKQLGYYAKDKDGNLFRFEWSSEDEFFIALKGGVMQTQDPKDYEILEIGHFDADSPKELTINEYHALRDIIWSDLCAKGVFQDDNNDAYKDFDEVLGNRLAVDFR